MEFKINGCKFYISIYFIAFLCLILLVDTTGIMLFGLLSVLLHETGHLFFMLLCKKVPKSISFQLGGIIIKKNVGLTSINNDLLIALGGCLFNLIAFLISTFFYKYIQASEMLMIFAATNFSLLVFNLLPINGLDGIDILKNVLYKNLDELKSNKICNIISIIFMGILFVLSVEIIGYTKSNCTLLICFCYLVILALINFKH